MAKKPSTDSDAAQPQYKVDYREIQPFGTLKNLPIALEDNARSQSVAILNQVLADTMTLRDMYKKHHWQMSGATFYQLHLLLDKHYEEQAELVDTDRRADHGARRDQHRDGPRRRRDDQDPPPAEGPRGRPDPARPPARGARDHPARRPRGRRAAADESGDDGTNDLLVSNVIRTNEPQVWFIAEHLAETALVRSDR